MRVISYIFLMPLLLLVTPTYQTYAFAGGDGSVGDPYQISTCLELQDVDNDLTANYILINDIDCSDTVNWNSGAGFEPLGFSGGTNFSGTLDGQGYIVSDMFMSRTLFSGVGIALFRGVGGSGNVSNLTLSNVDFTDTGNRRVAGISASIVNGTIENVHVTGTLSGDDEMGGIAANGIRGTVRDCSFDGTMSNTANDATIGGIAPRLGPEGATIERCYSSGTISGGGHVGGIVGDVRDEFGGPQLISNSYSTASLETSGGSGYGVGGIVGHVFGDGNSFTLEKSYAAASITGGTQGGLVATTTATNPFNVNDSFWDTDISTSTSVGGGTGTTTVAMKDIDTFTNWDIVLLENHDGLQATAVWYIDDSTDYPRLYFELTVPGAPTSLTATTASSTQINLSWTAPNDDGNSPIAGYRIERESPEGGGFSDLVANTGNTDTTYSDTGLTPATEYNYRVSAINSVGTSTSSNTDSATTDATTPDKPTNLTATANSSTQISLSWTAPNDDGGSSITGYKIERESPTGNGFTTLVEDTESTDTTYQDLNLTPETQYNYQVSTLNSVGTSTASDPASATTEAEPEEETTTTTSSSSGSSASGQVFNLTSTGNFSQALKLINQNPHLYTKADRQEVINKWVISLQKQVITLLKELIETLK